MKPTDTKNPAMNKSVFWFKGEHSKLSVSVKLNTKSQF